MRKGLVAVALLAVLAGGAWAGGGSFKDPLDVAAAENAIAVRSQLTGSSPSPGNGWSPWERAA